MKHKLILFLTVMIMSWGCSYDDLVPYTGKVYINDQVQIIRITFGIKPSKHVIYSCPSGDYIYGASVDKSDSLMTFSYGHWDGDNMRYGLILYHLNNGRIDTLITRNEKRFEQPVISPNGKYIIFLTEGELKEDKSKTLPITLYSSRSQCALYDVSARTLRMISDTNLILCPPCWYSGSDSVLATTYDNEIIRLSLDGKTSRNLFSGCAPALSPDNNELAYLDPVDNSEICIFNRTTKQKRKITSGITWFTPQRPNVVCLTWSPDMRQVLYQGQNPLSHITSWSSQFVVMNVVGRSSTVELENITACGYGASWVK